MNERIKNIYLYKLWFRSRLRCSEIDKNVYQIEVLNEDDQRDCILSFYPNSFTIYTATLRPIKRSGK